MPTQKKKKKVKVESEKVGLKLNIQETKTMASSPITSWQIDGETVAEFNFLVLSLLHSPTLTSIHDHRKNHSLD